MQRRCYGPGQPPATPSRLACARVPVLAPVRDESATSSIDPRDRDISVNINDVRRPVAADMDAMVQNLMSVVGDRHPMLLAAAEQIFGAGGKRLRPMLVFLVARATSRAMAHRCGRAAPVAPSHSPAR